MRSTVWLRAVLSTAVLLVVVGLTTLGTVQGWLGGVRAQLVDTQFPTGPIDDRLLVVELPLCSQIAQGAVGEDATGTSVCGRYDGRPRALHADVIQGLSTASAIGYDVVFDEFDPTREDDLALQAAIAEAGNVVLAAAVALTEGDGPAEPLQVIGATEPAPGLAEVAAGLGHAGTLIDPIDGVVRRLPLVTERDRRFVPSLSLATTSLAEGLAPGAITLMAGQDLQVGTRRIRTSPSRVLEINWAWSWEPGSGPDPDPLGGLRVPVLDVLEGRVDATGRIVFVGVANRLVDWRETAVNKAGAPGVHVHANAANTMLTNLFRSGPDADTAFLGILAMVGAVVVGGIVVRRLRWIPLLALLLVVLWQGYVNIRHQQGVAVDNLWPVLAVLAGAAGVTGARYAFEERHKRRVAGLFKQYVPDAVADELINSDRLEAAADGERVEVTVLFCDLRGFTRTAADLEPPVVRQMLEVYYDHLTHVIHQYGGTVMQFVGDEVFAVFGAPTPLQDHPQRALDCAVAMQGAAEHVNRELAPRGVRIAWGIGINSGSVVAAHVGSAVHKQYAVVGNTVNVGARLCGLADPGGVVASIHTLERLAVVPEAEELPPVELKGVQEDPRPHRILMPEQLPSGPL